VPQSAPAIHQHEDGNGPKPNVMRPEGETDESDDADETEDRGYHQASSAAQHKPEQRSKDLATIQGINGQNVENQQA
jgi:hypothetical protein